MVVKSVGLLALAIALVSCQSQALAAPPAYNLNEVFTVGGGQQASIRGENLSLSFTDVPEDSRCPTAVDCVWAGQARIAVEVQPQGTAPTTTEFTVNTGETTPANTVGAYTIELHGLDPYPEDTTPIPFGDYRATLMVTKS